MIPNLINRPLVVMAWSRVTSISGEQQSGCESDRVGIPNAGPKVRSNEKITSGSSEWPWAAGIGLGMLLGHSWALGTPLESVAANMAAASIHFAPF